MRSSSFLLAACAALLLASGCSKGSSGGSGSTGGSGTTTGSTGSSGTTGTSGGDAGPTPCTTDTQCTAPQVCQTDPGVPGFCGDPCSYDDQCAAGKRCDDQSGHCVPAAACDDTLIASPVDACADSVTDAGYCGDLGNRCRCTTADGGKGAGVCRRVRASCDPCSDAGQCNPCPEGALDCDPSKYVFPATCAPVGDAGSYCLRVASGAGCPFGYVGDPATGTCQPNTGVCSGFAPCATDDDCVTAVGAGHYCDTSTGICKEYCKFDFTQGTSVNCPPGQVCNVNPRYVLPDAGLARYGVGTCGAPCDAANGTDCAALGQSYGLTYACVQEKGGEHRCRPVAPAGESSCMDNSECTPWADGGVNYGYCDLYQFDCRYDCRVGVDPLTQKPYSDHDCQPPSGSTTSYKCADAQCVEKDCVERGGAHVNGSLDQLCCGEDRDHTGYGDAGFADITHPANACAPGVDAGEFYLAPAPPWCHTGCDPSGQQDPDSGAIPFFATCGAAAGIPSLDSLGSPNMCIVYAQDQSGNPVADCTIAANYNTECPKGWQFGPVDIGCNADTDCSEVYPDGGASAAGHCVLYPDGGGHYCGCSQPELADAGGYLWGGQCPGYGRCVAQRCAFTKGCMPTPGACGAAP